MIIGVAGHVDHGKSSLVTALTGRAMDRLAEERQRGITIELNFAPLELVPGTTAGIIDVPGHEDFVRTMVAGASGIDVAVLVIAADDGIMPQTREHLRVLEFLGVAAGVAVITKADAVDSDWLALVRSDVTAWLARSSVQFGEPIVASTVTGEGIGAVRARLAALSETLALLDRADLFRLPIDRVFTVAGTGTVVTGTAISGSIEVGQGARILPSGIEVRVRSIELHGAPLQASIPGTRTAVALSGAEREEISRGEVLVGHGDPWESTTRLDAWISLAEGTAHLADRARVRVHHGTAEVMARVRVDTPLNPGEGAVARLTLETPLLARGTDRLVLRSFSPVMVIGGGWVVDPLPESRRRMPGGVVSPDPATRLDALVERRRHGVDRALLAVLLGLSPATCTALLERSTTLIDIGGLVVRTELVEHLATTLVERVEAFHVSEPHEAGIGAETLRHSLRVPDAIAAAALAAAESSGRVASEAGVVAQRGFRPLDRMSEPDLERLLAAVREGGITVAPVAELATRLKLPSAAASLEEAARRGDVVRVEPDRYVAVGALEEFSRILQEVGAAGTITPGLVRDRSGLSRKYLIPLLEWADRSGITRREGDGRRLRTPAAGAIRGA